MKPEIVVDFLLHALNQNSQQVQATAAVGIAKLMLSGILTDGEVCLAALSYAYYFTKHLAIYPGSQESRAGLFCSRNNRQSRIETMLELFLPCLLLFSIC